MKKKHEIDSSPFPSLNNYVDSISQMGILEALDGLTNGLHESVSLNGESNLNGSKRGSEYGDGSDGPDQKRPK